MAENQFDTIYHEHFSYFSFVTIEAMAVRHGLKLIDVEELPTHGGSLRVYLAHRTSSHPPSEAVAALLAREERLGFRDIAAYSAFAEQVKRTKRRLLSALIAIKNDGKTDRRLWRARQGQYASELLRHRHRFPRLHRRPQSLQARPLHAGHAHSRSCRSKRSMRPAGLYLHPAVEPEAEIIQQMRHARRDCGGKFIVPIPDVTIIDPEGHPLMKVVLFCGGLGTRIREYSESIPKPMIPVGHQPIMWHIMQYYSQLWAPRLRALPGLQSQHHQGLLPQLPPAILRRLRGFAIMARRSSS